MSLADIHKVITALDQELNTGYSTQTEGNSYIDQRKVINELFKREGCFVYGRQLIVQRLTILDALYSTNARFTYFTIDQMADAILAVGGDQAVGDYFYSLVLGGKDTLGLFSQSYGFTKDLGIGRLMISLLSKYAFYVLLQDPQAYPLGFPIYDNLVHQVYPKACRLLGVKPVPTKEIKDHIEGHIAALQGLQAAIWSGGFQTKVQPYDALDAYLWRIGKLRSKSISLLLSQADYWAVITKLGLTTPSTTSFETRLEQGLLQASSATLSGINPLFAQLVSHWAKYYHP
ncbi:hypothetical protein [Porphyromonas sp.]